MVVEGLRYLLTQPFSQGHPQLSHLVAIPESDHGSAWKMLHTNDNEHHLQVPNQKGEKQIHIKYWGLERPFSG